MTLIDACAAISINMWTILGRFLGGGIVPLSVRETVCAVEACKGVTTKNLCLGTIAHLPMGVEKSNKTTLHRLCGSQFPSGLHRVDSSKPHSNSRKKRPDHLTGVFPVGATSWGKSRRPWSIARIERNKRSGFKAFSSAQFLFLGRQSAASEV
jgi:hypothetical protein